MIDNECSPPFPFPLSHSGRRDPPVPSTEGPFNPIEVFTLRNVSPGIASELYVKPFSHTEFALANQTLSTYFVTGLFSFPDSCQSNKPIVMEFLVCIFVLLLPVSRCYGYICYLLRLDVKSGSAIAVISELSIRSWLSFLFTFISPLLHYRTLNSCRYPVCGDVVFVLGCRGYFVVEMFTSQLYAMDLPSTCECRGCCLDFETIREMDFGLSTRLHLQDDTYKTTVVCVPHPVHVTNHRDRTLDTGILSASCTSVGSPGPVDILFRLSTHALG